jgi:hypothetical protein
LPHAAAHIARRPFGSAVSSGPSVVDQLGEDIAILAARLHAATYELLLLLRRFDDASGWNNGFRSCAHWLHWRTGIDLGAAREKVRVAHALADLPRLSNALQLGVISYAKVRALTRVATPVNESQLLDVALTVTAFQVERVVRAWRRCDRVAEARQAEARHLHRGLRTYVDDDGMLVVHGRLTPEQGAVVQRALEAAADELWRETKDAATPEAVIEEVTHGQRRADALVRLAEAALAGNLEGGTAGDRYQVVLHVDAGPAAPPAGEPTAFIGSTIECGDRAVDVSAETSARLACDAAVVVMRHDAAGNVLNVGRKTRSVPPAIRRALDARDTGCRFPGCTARRCDAHHVVHWATGGATSFDNLVLLCRHHHLLLHEGGYSVRRGAGRDFTFVNAAGRIVPAVPAAPDLLRVAQAGASLCRLLGDEADRPATPATSDGSHFNLGYVVDALRGNEPIRSSPRSMPPPRWLTVPWPHGPAAKRQGGHGYDRRQHE